MSWKRIALVVVVGLLMAACFYAGMVAGNRQALGWMLGVLETEVTGSLHQTVSALTLIRAGDQETAIRLLETRVDAAVSTLPQGREWAQLPEDQRRNLVLAKKYFAKYPPRSHFGNSIKSLEEVLQWIPDEPLDPGSCNPAVRLFLEGNLAGGGSPTGAE